VQAQRLAIEQKPPAGPAQLAQPDARVERRLARDHEAQPLQRRMAGLPQVRVLDARAGAHEALGAAGQAHRREAQRRAGERTAHLQRPRRGAVGHAHGDVDHGRRSLQTGDDRWRIELAQAQRQDGDRAVDAAEVEPRAVPRIGLHRRRVAPVGAHDEHVRAGGQARSCLERQVGADVVRDLPPVDPHGRAVVDRVEAHRVVAVAGDVDRRAIPGHRALERARPRRAAHVARVGCEGHRHGAPAEVAARPAERDAAPGAVAADDPRAVERTLTCRRGRRRQRTLVAALLPDGAGHHGQDAQRDRQARSQHGPARAAHQSPGVAATRAVSARPCRVRVDKLLTTLLTAALARRLRWRGNGR
jgi:hypothetical protein